ncbi:MAG: hypothetical protein AAF518_07975 [Spirochaetota bacterium]
MLRLVDVTLRDGLAAFSLSNHKRKEIFSVLWQAGMRYFELAALTQSQNSVQYWLQEFASESLLQQISGAEFYDFAVLVMPLEFDQAALQQLIKVIPNLRLHTFYPVGPYDILQSPANFSEKKRRISRIVELLKQTGCSVQFTAFDGMRAKEDELLEAYATAVQAGADSLCLADSNGDATPKNVASFCSLLKNEFSLPIGVHLHNANGLAVEKSLAAQQAGAAFFEVSLCGIGLQGGNADLRKLSQAFTEKGITPIAKLDLESLEKAEQLLASLLPLDTS